MKCMIRLLALGVMFSALFGVNLACNTTEGLGKDIERTGDKIEDAADAAK